MTAPPAPVEPLALLRIFSNGAANSLVGTNSAANALLNMRVEAMPTLSTTTEAHQPTTWDCGKSTLPTGLLATEAMLLATQQPT